MTYFYNKYIMPEQVIFLKVLGTHDPLEDEADNEKFSLTKASYTIKNISFNDDGTFGQEPNDVNGLVDTVSNALQAYNMIAGGGTKKRRKRRKKNKKRKTINRK